MWEPKAWFSPLHCITTHCYTVKYKSGDLPGLLSTYISWELDQVHCLWLFHFHSLHCGLFVSIIQAFSVMMIMNFHVEYFLKCHFSSTGGPFLFIWIELTGKGTNLNLSPPPWNADISETILKASLIWRLCVFALLGWHIQTCHMLFRWNRFCCRLVCSTAQR